ncbi:hypothetical protein RJ527_08975 [Thalassospiraceae bacterium LMO-SO8]|nr:hypothetical protein [Alphaproteobacteria bacterium LMO-S08]WND77863.1 hypothetical protein RJ527_08975 [Thalassospiraceae bacterium LMO-SO8]
MKSALGRLREIASGNRSDEIPSLLDFPSLDVDKLSSSMQLEEQGEEQGRAGKPLAGASALDPVELQIIDRVVEHQRDAHEQLNGQLGICTERLRRLHVDSLVTSVKAETRATVTDFEQEARNGENTLYQLRRELIEATDALEAFKTRHSIDRPAHQRPNIWVTGFILIAVFLVETLANAGLIGAAHESGYIGAYTLAVSLSFINVITGWSAGIFGLRFAHHSRPLQKLWGVLLVLTYLVSVAWFNLYVAHVRDAMQSSVLDDALRMVWKKTFEVSLDFHDYQAPLMLIIGVVFSLVAFYKGFKNDDPFPDYGRQSRLRDQTEARYADTFAEIGDHLQSQRDDVKDALKNVSAELGFRRQDYFSITATINRLLGKYQAYERSLEHSARRLLSVYREANRKSRKKGEPRHFKRDFVLERLPTEEPSTDEIFPKEKVERMIEETQTLIERSIEEVDEAHQRAFKRYGLISQLLSKEKLEEIASSELPMSGGNVG